MKELHYSLGASVINVINTPRVEAYIESLIQKPENNKEVVKKWIKSNLRNYLLKEENPERIHLTSRKQFSMLGIHVEPKWLQGKELPDNLYYVPINPELKHYVDAALIYITYMADVEGKTDLSKVSVPDALIQGERTHQLRMDALKDAHYETEGIKPILKVSNGYLWVKILTTDGLKRESKYMGHCVGDPGFSYGVRLEKGEVEIWSLRDRNNLPHCTCEYIASSKLLKQIRSKDQFIGLAPRYWTYLEQLLESSFCRERVTHIPEYELEINFKDKKVWTPIVKDYTVIPHN